MSGLARGWRSVYEVSVWQESGEGDSGWSRLRASPTSLEDCCGVPSERGVQGIGTRG